MSGLPQGWAELRLGEITKPNRPRRNPQELDNMPYVGMEQVESNTRRLLGTQPSSDMKSTAFHFHSGDILYGRLRPYLNKVYYSNMEGLCSSEFIVLPPNEELFDSQYLAYYLTTDRFVSFANSLNQGDRPRVSFDQISGHVLPLAPLNEQRRIVAKLEELLAKVNVSQKRLARVPAILKRFRQAVLAAACSGRLTADWREGQGIGEGEELPARWKSCCIADVGKVCNGSTPSRKCPGYWNGDIRWVSSGEVRNNIITETRESITQEGYNNSSVRLLPEDTVLLAMIGEGKTRGQTAILKTEATINQNIAAVVINQELITSEYLWHWFQRQYETTRQSGSGSGPQALNCQRVRELPLNLPPLSEQQEIVRRLESFFKRADQLEARYRTAQVQVDKLTQAILAKAFRGELVPQDPNDEPTAALLERIRSHKIVQPKITKKKSVLANPAAPEEKAHSQKRPVPAPTVVPVPLSKIAGKILRYMKPGREYTKDDIVVPLVLSTGGWNSAIRELKEAGVVVQTGDKRGAKYHKINADKRGAK